MSCTYQCTQQERLTKIIAKHQGRWALGSERKRSPENPEKPFGKPRENIWVSQAAKPGLQPKQDDASDSPSCMGRDSPKLRLDPQAVVQSKSRRRQPQHSQQR